MDGDAAAFRELGYAVGQVIGYAVFLGVIVLSVVWLVRRRRRKDS